MKGESAFNLDRGEAELLPADVLRDEIVAVDSHLLEILVVAEVAKGDAAGEADRVVHHDGLPAVPSVATLAVVIISLVASHNSPADGSDQCGKGDASATATAEGSRPDEGAFTHCQNSHNRIGDTLSSSNSWNNKATYTSSAGLGQKSDSGGESRDSAYDGACKGDHYGSFKSKLLF